MINMKKKKIVRIPVYKCFIFKHWGCHWWRNVCGW